MSDVDGPVVTAVEPEAPRQRPSRPALIELAAALLIVAGLLGILSLVVPDPAKPEGLEGLTILTIVLNVVQIIVGLLVRAGRLWIVDVNYVAILGFLDLAGAAGSSLALLLGLIELGILAVLFVYRSWFDGRWAEPSR
ncbi:MAG: hypothetical protein HY262_12900 [Chloroflexi bacterium]|nr:hypothetical protein [Chloroflexota bacterium]